MTNLPSTNVYSISDLNINLDKRTVGLSAFVIDRLYARTLNGIITALKAGIIINSNGALFINISYLHTLLRTNPGAANTIWQDGIPGYVSGVDSRNIQGDLYITGSDFIGLLDARLQTAIGQSKIYLQFIQAAYSTISTHPQISDVRTAFIKTIDRMRSTLKKKKIQDKNITCCEFTGFEFERDSQVEFAHINSIITDPENALNINNGVIIMKKIHAVLTQLQVQNFSGMYEFCQKNDYSTAWAEDYSSE
ncbi:hypothetical protein EGM70_20470 [Enterobacteriaceae bacterium 89]|nr:hypothetical protein [Enterobacteriaceae bacterium 89]